MQSVFEPFLAPPQQARFRPVNGYRSQISAHEALQDMEELAYLLDNRYCGKDYWQRQGVDFSRCYRDIADFVTQGDTVYISDFCRAIHRAFDRGIVDNHLAFCSPITGRLTFSRQYTAYFAGITAELREGRCTVVSSETEAVRPGDIIGDEDAMFETLSHTGHRRFLVGRRSFEPLKKLTLTVNGQPATVPLHRCRTGDRPREADVCMAEYTKDGVRVLRANCCDYVGELREDTDLCAMGAAFRNSPCLLLNYLDNQGGYNRITREFIRGLNGYVHCREDSMALRSPVTDGEDCPRRWVPLSVSSDYEREKGCYDGTVYLLVNSATASAGETAVLYARSLKHLVLVGENTMGCNTFGNVASYALTHSGIVCQIPNVINLCDGEDYCREGWGFTPDFWVDSLHPEEEVIRWINRQG